MRTIWIILCLFLVAEAQAQVVASSCKAKDSIVALYRNDADKLAIRSVYEDGTAYRDSVGIDKRLSKDFLDALVAVYNATSLRASDTVTRLLNIHAYNPGLNGLTVIADSNLVWMRNLRYNIYPTRDDEIDRIMAKYELKKTFYSDLMQPSMVVFRTSRNSNLAPLAQKLKSHLGVKLAEAEYFYGDGNNITASLNEKGIELVYSYGWMDCPSGCLQRRYWKFRVLADCSVEYLESYGSPLDPSILVSTIENEHLFGSISIYPNPSKYKLYVECDKPASKKVSLTMTNKRNQVVYSLTELEERQEIDMIFFPSGIYQLKLEDGSGKKVLRVRKL